MDPYKIIAKVTDLPPPSPSVVRLLTVLSSSDGDNCEAVEIVRRDAVLSAKLIAVCNSASFGLAGRVASVNQAVHFLGHSQIQRLVMAIGFGGPFSKAMGGYGIGAAELRRHCIMTASACVAIAEHTLGVSVPPSTAYTAGLLHDIGKIVINQALDKVTLEVMQERLKVGDCSLVEAEQSIVGTDHAEVGGCLLRRWELPEVLIEAVTNHHRPTPQPNPQLSTLVHVADVVALEAGRTAGTGVHTKPVLAAFEVLSLRPDGLDHLITVASESLRET